jgi:hypothetical protein
MNYIRLNMVFALVELACYAEILKFVRIVSFFSVKTFFLN